MSPEEEDRIMAIIRSAMPFVDGFGVPCPDCQGEGCEACAQLGYIEVDRETFEKQ